MEQSSYVITGASSYLGREMARYFQKKGGKIVLTSRSVSHELENLQGDSVRYLPGLDLTNDSDLNQLQLETGKFLVDRFHVLNCIGYFPGYKSIEDTSDQEARDTLMSNVLTVFGTANRLLPLMVERGGGFFVGYSMHTAYQHYPYMGIFTAAKQALEGLIKGISNEYLEKGIHANVVSMATLLTETECRMKPHGDYDNWLEPINVCEITDNLIEHSNGLVNGTVIHTYKYSDTYFGQSYIERIKRDI